MPGRGGQRLVVCAAREAIAAAPDDAHAWRLQALAQAGAGDHEAAMDSIQRALRLQPDNADLHFQHAGLLLGGGDTGAAGEALTRATGLDPNQFGAYVMQAQLALGRGDVDEAERLRKLAARLEPDHPWVRTIEGMLALRRGEVDFAQIVLSQAAEIAPEDPQVRYALGFAYMAAGHFAFAEQAFRRVIEASPQAHGLRTLVAELLRRQGRPAEGAAELTLLLIDPQQATPALQRFAGELYLAAGRHDAALPLLSTAFDAQPRDPRTLAALVDAWRLAGDPQPARERLDAALATHPDAADLWRARLGFEPVEGAPALVDRWLATEPAGVAVHEARMAVCEQAGDADGALSAARTIVAREPGHAAAELRIVDAMMREHPAAAVGYVESLLASAGTDAARRLLRGWLALALDRADRHADAVAAWTALQAADAPNRLPLPTLTAPPGEWPPASEGGASDPLRAAFLVGAPGSGVERVAAVLAATVPCFRADRFGPAPPDDALQNYNTPAHLRSGEVTGAVVFDHWRNALAARALDGSEVVDWLLWWDNALLGALRPALREAPLLVALRDPRDMFLDWLAFGVPVPMRIEDRALAAQWLARALEHVAVLHEQALFPHVLLRLDGDEAEPAALARRLGEVLQSPLAEPPAGALAPLRLPAGRWRAYRDALASEFALLTPVAARLGYAAD